jgi:hypothetical protein
VAKKSDISYSKIPDMLYAKITRLYYPFLFLICLKTQAQSGNEKKSPDFKSIVQSKKYAFLVQSATAKKGKTIHLTPGYGLILMNDSISVHLPYYGRAYNTGYTSTDNSGIQFDTRDFTYSSDSTKKDRWEITIRPKGVKVTVMYLSISSSGYCSVRINSSDRDVISYYGTIEGLPPH